MAIGNKVVPNVGFGNFKSLKKYLGSHGDGKQWHHIVEHVAQEMLLN